MTEKETAVQIFYSTKTEPELLTFYADGLAYLRDQDIEMEIIDVTEEKKKAKKFEIKTTPTVIISRDGEELERYEVVSYLNGILERKELKRIVEKH